MEFIDETPSWMAGSILGLPSDLPELPDQLLLDDEEDEEDTRHMHSSSLLPASLAPNQKAAMQSEFGVPSMVQEQPQYYEEDEGSWYQDAEERVNQYDEEDSGADADQVVPGTVSTSQPQPVKRRRMSEHEIEKIKTMPEAFADLKGTTAMQARRMSPDEREVVLMKRKLRNRQSAKRSRMRRQMTLNELNDEFRAMVDTSDKLREQILELVAQNKKLKMENARLCGFAV